VFSAVVVQDLGWHVSSMDGKNQVISITEEILSSLPFWEEMEETPKFDKY